MSTNTKTKNMGQFALELFLDVYVLFGLCIELTCLEELTSLRFLLTFIAYRRIGTFQ